MKKQIFTLISCSLLSGVSHAEESAFNPKISFIFDGAFYQDSKNGEGAALVTEAPGINGSHGHEEEESDGHDHEGHEHGLEEGFNLREQELVLSASIDNYFDGFAVIAISEDETEIEEAYFTTRSLPAGLKVKGGKFFSGIGYHNQKHVHQWDFADQNIAYGALLGDHGLVDKGLQVTWLPNAPMYTLVGVEFLQGDDQEKFGILQGEAEAEELGLNEEDSGPRITTLFAKVSPELDDNHALQLGAWYAHAKQDQLVLHHEHDGEEEELGLEGDGSTWGLDVIYKLDSAEAYGKNDLTIQAEYLSQSKDWKITNDEEAGESVSGEQDGLYIQAVYGIAPRWKAGLRYDATGFTNKIKLPEETEKLGKSSRLSAVTTWYPTEFSFIRAQYSSAEYEGMDDKVHMFLLQFNYSLGAHGAHAF